MWGRDRDIATSCQWPNEKKGLEKSPRRMYGNTSLVLWNGVFGIGLLFPSSHSGLFKFLLLNPFHLFCAKQKRGENVGAV